MDPFLSARPRRRRLALLRRALPLSRLRRRPTTLLAMLLAIDVGNPNIVYGLFDGERLLHQFRVESARGRTADEYAAQLRSLLEMRAVDRDGIEAAIIACVVPSLTEAMVAVGRSAFGRTAMVVGPGMRPGI